jgi:hypothetical protein
MSFETLTRRLRHVSILFFAGIAVAFPLTSDAATPAHLYVYRITVTGYDHHRESDPGGQDDELVRWVTVFKGVPIEVRAEGRGLAIRLASIRQPTGTAKPQSTFSNTRGSGCQTGISYPSYSARMTLTAAPGSSRLAFSSYLSDAAQSAFTRRASTVVGSVCPLSVAPNGDCVCVPSGMDQFRQRSDQGVLWKQNGALLEAGFERTRGAPLAFPLSALHGGHSFTIDSGLFRRDLDCGDGCTDLTESRITVRFSRS